VIYRVYARFSAFPPIDIIRQWSTGSMHVFLDISIKRYHSSVVYARFSAFTPRDIIRQWSTGSMHVFLHLHQEISFASGLCTFFSISTNRYHSSVVYARFSAFPPIDIIRQWSTGSMHVFLDISTNIYHSWVVYARFSGHFHQEISFVSDLQGLCTFFWTFPTRDIIRQWSTGSMHVFLDISTNRYHSSVVCL
jgi:hypothetical protein